MNEVSSGGENLSAYFRGILYGIQIIFKNHYYGWYHFYGHVHTGFEDNMMQHVRRQMEELYNVPCNMFNVGVMKDYMGYTPRTFEEIINSERVDIVGENLRITK